MVIDQKLLVADLLHIFCADGIKFQKHVHIKNNALIETILRNSGMQNSTIDSSHPRYVMSYHWHVECEIMRVLQGTLTVTLDEKSFTAKAGDVIFVNSGVLHSGIQKEIHRYLEVCPHFFQERMPDIQHQVSLFR